MFEPIVVIEAGMPCDVCSLPITSQSQEPLCIHCEPCGEDHFYHGVCVPDEVKEAAAEYSKYETAQWN